MKESNQMNSYTFPNKTLKGSIFLTHQIIQSKFGFSPIKRCIFGSNSMEYAQIVVFGMRSSHRSTLSLFTLTVVALLLSLAARWKVILADGQTHSTFQSYQLITVSLPCIRFPNLCTICWAFTNLWHNSWASIATLNLLTLSLLEIQREEI